MDVHPNPGPLPTETSVNSLDVLHLNTRSIRNKLDYIKNIAESFRILCFSGTHLDASVTTYNLLVDGFDEPFRKDRLDSIMAMELRFTCPMYESTKEELI